MAKMSKGCDIVVARRLRVAREGLLHGKIDDHGMMDGRNAEEKRPVLYEG